MHSLLAERSQPAKAAYYGVPTIWHSRKGETVETARKRVVSRGGGWGMDGQVEKRGFGGRGKHYRWYCCGEYMSLFVYPNPQNKRQEWTLTWTVAFRGMTVCQCRSSCKQPTTLDRDVDTGEALYVRGWGNGNVGNLCSFPPIRGKTTYLWAAWKQWLEKLPCCPGCTLLCFSYCHCFWIFYLQ